MTTPGTQIGPYRIVGPLGSGGMGEVFRAHDTKLGRDVAIKLLPPALAQDPDRRARFEREARLLAALHHPHIATIFGVEDADGTPALVMELVEGPTLAERIARGPLPLKEVLAIARQIAEALDAAHEKGIVHRDLKPANIKLTSEGTVKVLDFGLATAVGRSGTGQSALETELVSTPGTVVGTSVYMSPEQTRGEAVDKRTDIWAFGCVLYELLTGRRVFGGATSSEVIAKVLEREPDWKAMPASTPASVRRLIERCLDKDPKRRLRDIGDVHVDFDDNAAAPSAMNAAGLHRSSRTAVMAMAAAIVSAAAAALAVWYVRPASPSGLAAAGAVTRFAITPPEPVPNYTENALAMSPDGRRVVYVAGYNGAAYLYSHDLTQLESKVIPGTQGADNPSFSPDGEWVAFSADRKIKKVALAGGEPLALCECIVGHGMSWGSDGNIYFNPGLAQGILRVSAQGGAPAVAITRSDTDIDNDFPELLPDGKALLFSAPSGPAGERIYVQSLKTGKRQALVGGRSPHYLPTGHIVYAQSGALFAVPFDAERLATTGEPVLVFQGIRQTPFGTTQIVFSRTGSVVYMPAGGGDLGESVVWVDRSGAERPTGLSGRSYQMPRLSPDGRRVAVVVLPGDQSGNNPEDLWMYDLDRNTLNRFTSDGGTFPLWTPDSRRLTFSSSRSGPFSILSRAFDGSVPDERLLAKRTTPTYPLSWSPDGRTLAFVNMSPDTGNDIWVLEAGNPGTPRPFHQTPFREGGPTFSPDGRFIAYASDASGRAEIYVRPFPGPGQEVTVSTAGGTEPLWARSKNELFYRQGNALMAVEIATAPALRVATPRLLLDKPYKRSNAFWQNYDVAPDGQRFLMIKGGLQSTSSRLDVVLNWGSDLKRLAPVGRR